MRASNESCKNYVASLLRTPDAGYDRKIRASSDPLKQQARFRDKWPVNLLPLPLSLSLWIQIQIVVYSELHV